MMLKRGALVAVLMTAASAGQALAGACSARPGRGSTGRDVPSRG